MPTQSIDFESGSSQYLSMSDANFGAFDHAKFAISVWVKRESSAEQAIITQWVNAGNQLGFTFQIRGDHLELITSSTGSNINGHIETNATISTGVYYHFLVWFDSANATAGDRMRMWIDGSEITSFATDTNPTAAVFDSSGVVRVGVQDLSAFFDGLIYQLGFFSGTLPAISDVYNAGSPKDISGLPGLYSYLDVAGGSVVSDGVLATDWTNNNTATASSTIPT